MIPPNWMRICGVVQNVSRPMLSCQEISHAPPTTLEITAIRHDQMYQGTVPVAAETCAVVWGCTRAGSEIVSAMMYLYKKSTLYCNTSEACGSYSKRGDVSARTRNLTLRSRRIV